MRTVWCAALLCSFSGRCSPAYGVRLSPPPSLRCGPRLSPQSSIVASQVRLDSLFREETLGRLTN